MSLAYRWKNLADVGRALRMRRACAERERWPRERLEAFQRERLGALVAHASARSPFYRTLYGGRVDRRDVRLEALPPVTKAAMMDDFDAFVTDPRLRRADLEAHLARVGRRDELFLGEFRVMASGGSSGRKGLYVYDRAAWSAFLSGAMRWTGFTGIVPRLPRPRLAQVAAPDAKHMTARGAASISVGLFRTIQLSATQPLGELAAALERHRPDALSGYPSVLALLAAEQLEGRLRIAPRTVTTTSEVRTPEMTARIRAAWGVEPFDGLGLTETGITAVDCVEHRGMHVFEDRCLLEVVDDAGRPVPAGQPGQKAFLTSLYNYTQPFIRFEVTDLYTVTDEPCGCGRTFRRITAIEGRSDDILVMPAAGGRTVRVHPIHVRSPLAKLAAVTQYQVVHEPDGLDVTLVVARGAEPGAVAGEVRGALETALRALDVAGVPVRVRVVERIEREAGAGKFKLVKSNVRPASAAA